MKKTYLRIHDRGSRYKYSCEFVVEEVETKCGVVHATLPKEGLNEAYALIEPLKQVFVTHVNNKIHFPLSAYHITISEQE